jgi:AhpD family alkylhydroperoxidase
MEARMRNPLYVVSGAMDAIQQLASVLHRADTTVSLELLYLRASQINGCAVCVDMHGKALRKDGEPEEKMMAVAAWRESAYFSDAERAALALAEAATRLCNRAEPVPDEVWNAATDHFSEEELATITLGVAAVNMFNRINATTRQIAGG